MNPNIKNFLLTIIVLLFMGPAQAEDQLTPIQELRNHTREFNKELIKLSDSVYAAVGYDGSNAAMIIGDDGVIIIDTLRALGAARELAVDFRKITTKPVKAIIYTHSHPDHIGGASAFAGNDNPAIYARANFSLAGIRPRHQAPHGRP